MSQDYTSQPTTKDLELEQLLEQEHYAKTQSKIITQNVDNLFDADHRNAMIRQYGGTMAQIITVGELMDY